MLCVFAVSDEVLNAAKPFAVIPVPILVVPSKNVTISPSGIEPSVEVVVDVKVTV
jgi:hypothetical protein